MHRIGMPELLVILAIALVIFGAKTLPKMGEAIGKTIGNFKRGIRDSEETEETIEKEEK
jgi:sec-independent protein translocase protein TatA